jgi:phage nucleotide-binding protein
MNALVYGPSGSGKTVNTTTVETKERGRNLLINTDNSAIVLRNFDRPNLDVVKANHWEYDYEVSSREIAHDSVVYLLDNAISSGKYDNIIVDCLTDMFDLGILEMEASGKYKDMRRAYMIMYHTIKRLIRKSGDAGTDIIWTAWEKVTMIPNVDGTEFPRVEPDIPAKIINQVCGLCNIVGRVEHGKNKDGKEMWLYNCKGSSSMIAKDQFMNRQYILPNEIFKANKEEK